MAEPNVQPAGDSPWRAAVETVRTHVSHKRDTNGSLGSINWLRQEMASRGANPNVVRNIIYRDKGKLHDKQVLFTILNDLMQTHGPGPLEVPALSSLVQEGGSYESEVLKLLGREKRRIFRTFVQSVQQGEHPKLLLTGRSGSGKSLMGDFIQQALEQSPRAKERIVRIEFVGSDLATPMARLANAVGVAPDEISSRLIKLESASAYAVQADAQAAIARSIIDAVRRYLGSQVLMFHVSATMGKGEHMGSAQLRLTDSGVTRVNAAEWLWVQLVEPLANLPQVAMLVTFTDVPLRAAAHLGPFQAPFRLTPPTVSEARRFVRARLGHLAATQQEKIVRLAGRSYEELRTLTLLAELREPGTEPERSSERSVHQLAKTIDSSDERLRTFLEAVATLSLPAHPEFRDSELNRLVAGGPTQGNEIAGAFVDVISHLEGGDRLLRCFSRDLGVELRRRMHELHPARFRELHGQAAQVLMDEAECNPTSDAAHRALTFLFEGRNWPSLIQWMLDHPIPQSLVTRIWGAAQHELTDPHRFEVLAHRVADHYVKLGNYSHPDVLAALERLSHARSDDLRAWTLLRRAEGLTQRGQYDQASQLLEKLPELDDPAIHAEAAIARASIERWRGRPEAVDRLVFDEASRALQQVDDPGRVGVTRVKHALWSGIIAKDARDYPRALSALATIDPIDDVYAARLAFQRGDIFMRLGQYDRALAALTEAVNLSMRADATPHERTRYRARRATVLRRLGQTRESEAEFEAALRDLQAIQPTRSGASDAEILEYQLWKTKIDDEMVILMLATSRFDEALQTLEQNRQVFETYASFHSVDLSYRLQRNRMRLALAYGSRAMGQPFRRPFPNGALLDTQHPDLQQARSILDGLMLETVGESGGAGLARPLGRDVLLAASMYSATGECAYALAQRAIDTAVEPYDLSRSHAHAAEAALRMLNVERAALHVEQAVIAHNQMNQGFEAVERGSAELSAWIMGLQIRLALYGNRTDEAGRMLADALRRVDMSVEHRGILTVFANTVVGQNIVDWHSAPELRSLLDLDASPLNPSLRLVDALLAQWTRVQACATPSKPHPALGSVA